MRDDKAIQREYTVSGMTCGHCVASVSEEVGDVAGVIDVDVDLTSGRMVVRSHGVSDYSVLAAVTEAGYTAART
ncbi:MAG: heavy-metal-associated domain-containing protein [Geodermatophilaceae bacterium]|jgi:copper chaperone CopZ